MRLTRCRRRLAGEEGFTLIELLVGISIGLVVLFAALTITEVGAKSASRTSDRAEVTQRSRTAMNQIVQGLRSQVCFDGTTPPIATGTADSVTYYAQVANDPTFTPEQRTLTFNSAANTIVETITPPSGPTRSRTLATNVERAGTVPVGTTPFLQYYTFDGAAPVTPPLDASLTSDPIPANSVRKVIRVDVAFRTRPTSGRLDDARKVDLEGTVYTRNSDFTDQSTGAQTRTWGPRCD